ncbi:hypothetical protein VSO92_12530 [Myroides pelagicus]|uniref:plasmid mobilization protein n=1 Tax=Myroides pelagicus TaxID=270914 RepID=UPI002DB6FCEE|nr:hypothetical protein [Myroides pelagicus]MEC4114928.1 hypothetical protein [Myroides pelagicus]
METKKTITKKGTCHKFYLNEAENKQFLDLLEKYQVRNKSQFIRKLITKRINKVVVVDPVTSQYHVSLSSLVNEFRTLGVNYARVADTYVKNKDCIIAFTSLQEQTLVLSMLCERILELALEYEKKHLSKSN